MSRKAHARGATARIAPGDQIRQLPPATVLRVAGLCDGHGVLDPRAFREAGLPEDVVAHLTHTHRSDGTPKGTLYVRGEPVKALSGVYGLDVLRFLAAALGVDYADAFGRGTEARNIQQALHQHFASPPTPNPSDAS